ncbi:cupin domain-containing protein [Phreatobacter oligotrophus]|jgi:transcriptional regulator with XRE-family HTH domain|uniref:XRE family transcriptional regulator n=1 Tax=Phreatobacter oligotrophus TaxID=1122261 RepID=A0A2T4ZH92_9HYPH|nr:cupin domain-containing protein [Phreatobacter oligotrophus]MBX9991390.1 cupin domain-containing protein [Phreatobacter oligotrophus]PTM61345.1 XRE family transcriptional regulator [Phreatobacter oligotrophus]
MSGRSSAGRAGAAPGPEALGEPPVAIADDGDQRLGETIRLMRQRAGLSIQEVAKRTGLSSGMISQVERALATPSVRTLRLLSIALGVPISYFFEEHEPVSPARYIVRKNDRRLLRLTASGVVKEALTPAEKGEIEFYELTLNPGGSSGSDFVRHTGEKAGYVLAGKLRLWLDHEAHVLEPGDSFRFPSTVPHMFDNPTQQVARVIWVTTLGPR